MDVKKLIKERNIEVEGERYFDLFLENTFGNSYLVLYELLSKLSEIAKLKIKANPPETEFEKPRLYIISILDCENDENVKSKVEEIKNARKEIDKNDDLWYVSFQIFNRNDLVYEDISRW